jgi:hypothetical protein
VVSKPFDSSPIASKSSRNFFSRSGASSTKQRMQVQIWKFFFPIWSVLNGAESVALWYTQDEEATTNGFLKTKKSVHIVSALSFVISFFLSFLHFFNCLHLFHLFKACIRTWSPISLNLWTHTLRIPTLPSIKQSTLAAERTKSSLDNIYVAAHSFQGWSFLVLFDHNLDTSDTSIEP